MAEPRNFKHSTFNIPAHLGEARPKGAAKLPYKKPQLARYGKLTELTRGGGGVSADGSKTKKTKPQGQA